MFEGCLRGCLSEGGVCLRGCLFERMSKGCLRGV